MKNTNTTAAATVLSLLLLTLNAAAQPTAPPTAPTAPASAASQPPIPTRSPAVKAAENARTPGELRPAQPVIPQLSIPLKSRHAPDNPAPSAAAASGGIVPGTVNDGAVRCRAMVDAKERTKCANSAK